MTAAEPTLALGGGKQAGDSPHCDVVTEPIPLESGVCRSGAPSSGSLLVLHQHFKKAICMQVCHTPHPELMPTLAVSGDLYHCQQESVEECPSRCQVAESRSEGGCQ